MQVEVVVVVAVDDVGNAPSLVLVSPLAVPDLGKASTSSTF